MCNSKTKVGIESTTTATATSLVAKINGRPFLQPTCNIVPNLERRNSIKKLPPKSLSLPSISPPLPTKTSSTPPISPKLKSPRPPATKRVNATYLLNTSSEKIVIPRNSTKISTLKKSKSFKEGSCGSTEASLSYSSNLITDSPGSIAGLRREQMALQHAQRKMKIAHYGRSKSAKFESVVVPLHPSTNLISKTSEEEEKRCSFITPNSGNSESNINSYSSIPFITNVFSNISKKIIYLPLPRAIQTVVTLSPSSILTQSMMTWMHFCIF